MSALAAVHGGLGDELRRDLPAQIEHAIELALGGRVERRVQTSSRRVLREGVLRRQRVGRSARFVPRICSWNQCAYQRSEQRRVRHWILPFVSFWQLSTAERVPWTEQSL